MNPWQLFKLYRFGKDIMNAKPLWKSKTFWLNILASAVQLGLPNLIPQPFGMFVLAGLNIGNRLLTNQPVTLTVT